MAVTTPTDGQSGWGAILNAALNALDAADGDLAALIEDLTTTVGNKSDTGHTHTVASGTGLGTIAQVPNGSVFVVRWDPNGTSTGVGGWVYSGAAVTARPTTRTSLTMFAIGNTTAPSFAVAGDVWLKEVA